MRRNTRFIRPVLILGIAFFFSLIAWTAFAGTPGTPPSTVAADGDVSWLQNIFESSYMPRQMCMNNEADVIWTHVISDIIIAAAYYSIPIALLYFVRRRRDIVFSPIFYCFAIFILACGTTHIFSVIAIWHPFYRLDGLIKAVTAGVSIITAFLLWPLIPKALRLPSPAELQLANNQLTSEINERQRAETELRFLTTQLEDRVQERTHELEQANQRLRQEITFRRQAEQGQSRLAAIVQSSNDAIVGVDLHGTIDSWNVGAQELFGFAPEEAIGKSTLLIVPSERHEEENRLSERLVSGERIEHVQTDRLTQDGRRIPVSITFSPIKDNEGNVIGISKIARDITGQKKAETERENLLKSERQARGESERASHAKDEFLATLSHELRTPINAILGWTQLIRAGQTSSAEDLNQGLEIIERNTRVQVRLIEDLLDMSRIISGKIRLDVQAVDLARIIEAAAETTTPAADAKSIRIQKIVDPHAGPVMGDFGRLQQIMWNLLSNAVKFTPRGGHVQIHLKQVNSHVEIVVSDDGQGIQPEFLPFIFDRFRQQDASASRRFGGLGLGLSIVRHLVELHGGSVRAASGGTRLGTSIFVSLPRSAIHDQRTPEEAVHPKAENFSTSAAAPSLAGISVLVVDDEPDARELIQRVLSGCGATVFLAGSAREAMERLRENRPTVLVCDIGMPEEDGYALIRRVRALGQSQGGLTPAVALTAFARAEDRRKVLLAGFQMHLAKPAEPQELAAIIANLGGVLFPK